MNLGVEKKIYYFNQEGKINLNKTVDLVYERVNELKDIKKILVFTADGEGAFSVKRKFNDESIKILAATFPYKKEFRKKSKDNETITIIPDTSKKELRDKLNSQNIELVQGVMPFQDIILPGVKDIKINTLNYTLSLISGGTRLCVQSILMACDGGYLEPGEYVISMSADTAIVARACNTEWLFHPVYGLEISEIICKPLNFSIIHSKKDNE